MPKEIHTLNMFDSWKPVTHALVVISSKLRCWFCLIRSSQYPFRGDSVYSWVLWRFLCEWSTTTALHITGKVSLTLCKDDTLFSKPYTQKWRGDSVYSGVIWRFPYEWNTTTALHITSKVSLTFCKDNKHSSQNPTHKRVPWDENKYGTSSSQAGYSS